MKVRESSHEPRAEFFRGVSMAFRIRSHSKQRTRLPGWLVVWLAATGMPTVGAGQNETPRAISADSTARVDEADITTRSQFAHAVEAAAAQQPDEAVDALLRAADADGDRLMRLPADPRAPWADGFTVFVPVRRYAQMQLAALAARDPELLRIYRRRVDAPARRWLEEAERTGDLAGFERVVDAFFLSSWGDDALWRMSEVALEHGRFVTARRALEQLHPRLRTPAAPRDVPADAAPMAIGDAPAERSWWLTLRAAGRLEQAAEYDRLESGDVVPAPAQWLSYPDGERQLADVEARAVLVSILAGESVRAEWELRRLKARHPQAPGQLNGRTGAWADLLTEWLAASQRWPRPSEEGAAREATVESADAIGPADSVGSAGAIRGGEFARGMEPAARPAWTASLTPWARPVDPAGNVARNPVDDPAADVSPTSRLAGNGRTRAERERRANFMASRPAYYDGRIIVQDASGIRVLDARSGAAAFPGSNESGLVFDAGIPVDWVHGAAGRLLGAPQFPLTIHDALAWARVGRPSFGGEPPVGIDAHPSRLVALDLRAEGKVARQIDLPRDANLPSDAWAGPPTYHEGRLYAILRRGDGIESQCHVVCLDAANGRLLWRRFVAAADAARPRRSVDWPNGILAVHEGRLLVDTQLGAIASISARTGAIEWLTRYPRQAVERDQPDEDVRFRRRSPTTCLVDGGLVVVMSCDFPRPFALEAATGQLVWVTSGPVAGDAVHLLGVGEDRLIVSGDSLYWFDMATGKSRGQFPPAGTAARGVTRPGPHGAGCGALAGGQVWWPAEDRILVFRQDTMPRETGWGPVAVREISLASRGAAGGHLLLANRMLYIACADRLYAFDDAHGRNDGRSTSR